MQNEVSFCQEFVCGTEQTQTPFSSAFLRKVYVLHVSVCIETFPANVL